MFVKAAGADGAESGGPNLPSYLRINKKRAESRDTLAGPTGEEKKGSRASDSLSAVPARN